MSNLATDLALLTEGFKRLSETEMLMALNPEFPEIRPSPAQQKILEETEALSLFVVGGNRSGKSSVGSRIASWWFNENHPYASRPPEWGAAPLTIMIIGRVGSQVEYELFEKKLKPFLIPGSYKTDIRGGVLQRIVHKDNGNQILFFSHHNITEAREKVQAFTAHIIWLDEMADSASFIAELQTRLFTTRGRLICTFTPLLRSEDVRRIVDGATPPLARTYRLRMFDNPLLSDPVRQKEILDSMKDMSDSEKKTRIEGEWYTGDMAVYDFRVEKHTAFPTEYSAVWRHVVSVDPAMSGKTGYTLWAEDPANGTWYCIDCLYLKNIMTPVELVNRIEAKIAGKNIVRRISDSHETWFIQTAAGMRLAYVGVFKKSERKHELIKNLQQALTSNRIKIAPHLKELIDEFLTCQWSTDNVTRIIGASRFHHLDATQYFVDNIPKFVAKTENSTLHGWEQELRAADKLRRMKEAKRKMAGSVKPRRRSRVW